MFWGWNRVPPDKPPIKPCKSWGCINDAILNDYCFMHQEMRLQHTVSHNMEGHSDIILDCPPCEVRK